MPRTEKYFIGPQLLGDIRRVVGRVEGTPYRVNGVTRREVHQDMPRVGGGGNVFRICTFTGSWSINASKTVTFRGVTATPNTVAAVNLFANIGTATASRNCAVAKDGTAWYLIAAECSTAT